MNAGKLCPLFAIAIVGIFAPLFSAAPAAHAQCTIAITSAYPCDSNGNKYRWQVGDPYYIRVNWNVTGTPKAAYMVKFTEANQTYTAGPIAPSAGDGYWLYVGWVLPLDEPVPYSIVIDPTHVTGNTDRATAHISGKIDPALPTKAVEYYDPTTLDGSETFSVDWADDSGDVTRGYTLLGCPATGTFQTVDSVAGPVGAALVKSGPSQDPVWQTPFTPFSPVAGDDVWNTTDTFTVIVSSERGNPNIMNRATWAELGSLGASMKPWLGSDTLTQSSDPAIASFVASVLPADYETSMTPYAAARALYLAVDKNIAYEDNQTDVSAVATLEGGIGNCAGMSDLYDACLRSIGIPARMDCGFWTGSDQWHCFTEFFLPECGWIPADTSEDRLWWDQTGTYAYLFGSDPPLNNICAVSRGTLHRSSQWTISDVQVGYFYYWGTASSTAIGDSSNLSAPS